MRTRRASTPTLAGVVVPLVALIAGCGGKETTASRSAAAYDEAQRKGTPVGKGEAHGQHGAASEQRAPEAAAAGEHAGHAMPGSGTQPREQPGMAGMDHSKMAQSRVGSSQPAGGHAGHAMPGPGTQARVQQPGTAGLDHSKMDHARTTTQQRPAMPMAPPAPEPQSRTAAPGQPAATLRPDEIDAPAPTSISEAERSAAMAKEMAGGHGMKHGAPYRQLDAGREDTGSPPQAKPAPRPDPHQMHRTPPAPPSKSTAPLAAPSPRASPAADPHELHKAPASPRPSPTPRPTPTPRGESRS